MKINKVSEVNESPQPKPLSVENITDIYLKLQDQYRNVFMLRVESQVFFYRSIGRGEYRKIVDDNRFDNMAKEELICDVCTLWPEGYSFEECDAGIPTVLCQQILKNSYLDKPEAKEPVLNLYRNEMWELDNQITAIINEAFPNFDIEDIENWDVEKTCKYLSRAEWKLQNLRGLIFNDGYGLDGADSNPNDSAENANDPNVNRDATGGGQNGERADRQRSDVKTQELQGAVHDDHTPDKIQASKSKGEEKTIRGGNKKEKLTPEKLRELKEKYPDIPWEEDSVTTEGIDSAFGVGFDTTSPALRPGW